MSGRKVWKTGNGKNGFCYHTAVNTKIIIVEWLHNFFHYFTLKWFRSTFM